ncbi:ribose-phosphate diphosphokinase family protein [Ehrlichia chaffeensis str. Heartland]|uniref:ribose-phosphate diphosphokinase n=1 Tax=Ehrlichia chaffeensis (strain ATCC CRL-10679 / Arkansas) TaxID=205920 RepID=Q2GFH3_EHRCR|nr:ribose-phosphate diphosphokinase [Ehrlichia chaffeensis]ABD44856.1 ribose-phosphate pyrophosphokinase [Ehrlichia chaffeensis str. Arkansas]AHX03314.1 ribose-phosphate diphosphokinase family protein [Ehrlichia chaffeensis str. Heartland]AHX05233.1 ribose-phosphate diphosphokinase family protein [Ehrlichia chaffeensis str. Jax]AHX06219.1 ribose-phosphate diphosphokinase family protein [Ehrlichia chaffeensis str. Liberty]AHX07525.1 ribose-phosphate diphosphokinase family protein [Ehrlichia cha
MLISSGTSSINLAKCISNITSIKLVNSCISRFSDQELNVEIQENQDDKNKHVIIINSLCSPAHDNLLELLLLTDAINRTLHPRKITMIIPYLCYTRQDRVMYRNLDDNSLMVSALSAKVIINILRTANINNIIFIDLHSNQLSGFFDIATTNLSSHTVFIGDIIEKHNTNNLVVVSPDYGALNRTRTFANVLSKQCKLHNEIQVAVIDKYRAKPGVSEVMNITGNVENKDCIIVDDIVDSAGTLCNAASALKDRGALQVSAYVTHGILSGNAVEKVTNSKLDNLIITDTIHNGFFNTSKIRILSIDKFLSNYILYNLV